MKKTLLSFLFAVGAFATVNAQTTIYSATFTGSASGWTTPAGTSGGTSSAAGTTNSAAVWTWDTNGSNGFYASGTGPIQSATAAGGFMILDSDSLDNGNQPDPAAPTSAWFGHGPAPSSQTAFLESPVINCSGYSAVRMSFSQYFRNFQSNCAVVVSNDGGLTWTSFPINTTIAANAGTPKNDFLDINISSVAANQSNVKVGFYWDGDYYFWMVDDITVYNPAPSDDIRIVDVFDMPYSQVPFGQNDTINFTGEYFNEGSNICNNLMMNVSITGAGSYSGNTSPALATINSGVDTFSYVGGNFYGDFLPTAKGTYNATYTISSSAATDATPSDNTKNRSFLVSDSTYAEDVNAIPSSGYPLYRTSSSSKFIIGNFYTLVTADTISSIAACFLGGTNFTTAGGVVQANVYMYDETAQTWGLVLNSNQITLANANISTTSIKWTKFGFNMSSATAVNGLILQPGSYIVALEALSTTSNVYVGVNSGSSLSRSYVYDDATNTIGYIEYGTTSMIRMNFGHSFPKGLGFENLNELSTGNIYPNPAQIGSVLTIPSNSIGTASLKVYNAIGEVVTTKQVTMSKNVSIETANLTEGLYLYTIEQNGKSTTGKFSLTK